MASDTEFRAFELQEATGRRLSGTAVRYGDTAVLPSGMRERFQPQAFGDVSGVDAILSRQHDRGIPLARTGGGGLELIDSAIELRVRAVLPDTADASDTLALIRAGVLRGLSIEFRATRERFEGSTRIIERATLAGVSVVDSGAYPQSTVEARQRRGGRRRERRTWIRGGIKYGVTSYCQCLDGSCKKVLFRPTALSGFDDDDVLGIVGRTSESVASSRGGTLRLRDTAEALEFEVDVAGRDTAAGRQLQDLARAEVSVYARPLVDDAASVFEDADGVRTYQTAKVKHLLLKPIAGSPELRAGWAPLTIPVDDPPPRRRMRIVL